MVTVNYINQMNGTINLSCLSTDELPTESIRWNDIQYEIKNSSTAFLIDKSCFMMFDEENKKWYELDVSKLIFDYKDLLVVY